VLLVFGQDGAQVRLVKDEGPVEELAAGCRRGARRSRSFAVRRRGSRHRQEHSMTPGPAAAQPRHVTPLSVLTDISIVTTRNLRRTVRTLRLLLFRDLG
jgi:hypothetical protein